MRALDIGYGFVLASEKARTQRTVWDHTESVFRRNWSWYTPAMLDIFDVSCVPAAQPLLEVIDTLRAMNRNKSRSVPQNIPLEWINQRWRPYVIPGRQLEEPSILAESAAEDCLPVEW